MHGSVCNNVCDKCTPACWLQASSTALSQPGAAIQAKVKLVSEGGLLDKSRSEMGGKPQPSFTAHGWV